MNEPAEFDPIVLEVRSNEPERAADRAWTAGAVGIEERPEALRVTFPDPATADAARLRLASVGDVTDVTTAVAMDWVDQWRPHANVTAEPPFVIRPPWLEANDVGAIELVIDPGPTFGHGAHPTTRLLLRSLPGVVSATTRVLDVGCGSGVLAIAAARLGALSVTAIDIDPVAIEVTVENAARNDVVLDASTKALTDLAGPFDVVVVNVTAAVLASLAADLVQLTSDCLLVSGLLVGQAVAGLDGFEVIDEEDGWQCCVLRCA